MNSRRLFSESNIGGHSYLSNMVHLPFYLQNSGLRKVKIAQQTAIAHRKNVYPTASNNEENLNVIGRTVSFYFILNLHKNKMMASFSFLHAVYLQRTP